MSRQLVSSNTPGERLANFSRAVRVGDTVFVSGTTASALVDQREEPPIGQSVVGPVTLRLD
jgi:enamine deaminase RidA (YjgF/YER057c/UK114 family)